MNKREKAARFSPVTFTTQLGNIHKRVLKTTVVHMRNCTIFLQIFESKENNFNFADYRERQFISLAMVSSGL